jgi:hypothetical protein
MSSLLPPVGPAALAAETGLAAFAADPIAVFRHTSKATKDATAAVSRFREVYIRAGNRSGKTYWASRLGTALARGETELDGVPIPPLGTPTVGAVLCGGRAMAEMSVIKAYLEAVGDWPHHVERNGNATEAIWVKPSRSRAENWREWSCIRFFVEGGQSLAGMRLDWAHADEPPDWEMWQELRMRGKANRHFVRFISATPMDKKRWKDLRSDFKGCKWPEGKDGKVEITLSVYDNSALSREDIKATEDDSKGYWQKAKLYGEYVDITGTNPFDTEGLQRWAARCCPPKEREPWVTNKGVPIEIEVWENPDEFEEPNMVVADPSAGIWDEKGDHDPCEFIVVGRVSHRIKVRYNGYLQASELGRLCRHYADRYGNALLVWERNSGYGEAFYLGVGGYGNVYVEHHRDARHLPLSERLGWLTTATTRGTVIGALQKAIVQDGLYLFSDAAVESLKDVVVDKNGRSEAKSGSHDEDMIVLGLAAHLLETMPVWTFDKKAPDEEWLERHGFARQKSSGIDPFALPST